MIQLAFCIDIRISQQENEHMLLYVNMDDELTVQIQTLMQSLPQDERARFSMEIEKIRDDAYALEEWSRMKRQELLKKKILSLSNFSTQN